MYEFTQNPLDTKPKNILEKIDIMYNIESNNPDRSDRHEGYLKGLYKAMEMMKTDDLDGIPTHKYRCYYVENDIIVDIEAKDILGVIAKLHESCYDYNGFYKIEKVD